MRKLLDEMLATGVISRSSATHYSQAMMVPKPGQPDKWRFVVDYRNLNAACAGLGWPLPNIKNMVQSIGAKRGKYFAVLDLTSGYHQVSLAQNSRKLAAFITPFGLYEPNRISMGLKSAPSFFQKEMSSNVLAGLVHDICELYIDDIIIWGETEEKFLANLEAVLARLEERNITINPDKAKIGLEEVNAVGYVLDHYGISMSQERIAKVMQFPRPVTGKQLKSFLGLANYFRDHILHYSNLAYPLERLILNYKAIKHKRLAWTADTVAHFEALQEAIRQCPKLYFIDGHCSIHLNTDASDYGVGAYLYQMVYDPGLGKDVEQPIAFMSKTLNGSQKNWSTIEKEGYAIFLAVRQWEYLLADRFFTIHTDHNNLRYLNTQTPKVMRWKLAIQEFDFQVEYIEGPKNVVADSLSRIVRDDDYDAFVDPDDEVLQMKSQELQYADDGDISEEEEMEEHLIQMQTSTRVKKRKLPASDIESLRANPQFRDALEQGIPLRPVQHHALEVEQLEYNRVRPWIQTCHNGYVGHHGVERTLLKLRSNKLEWPGMRRHVRRFISTCPQCQLANIIKPVIETPPFTTATYKPMSRINIDSIGPLPADSRGNKHVLVIIDCFSRFVELYPIPAVDAENTAPCLIDFVSRYGEPSFILSDKGSQFVNRTIARTVQMLGATHITTMAYSKEENAIVERSNKEVMRHLRKIIHELRTEVWSNAIPLVRRIMNAAPVDTLGVSPARIIFGNSVKLEHSVLIQGVNYDRPDETDNPAIKQWLDNMLAIQDKVIRAAQKTQLIYDLKNVVSRNPDVVTSFPVDSFVLLEYPSALGGDNRPPSKLHMHWRGPYRILKVNPGGVQYVLQDLVTLKESVHHVKQLKSFQWDSEFVNPTDVARANQNEFLIDAIKAHRGNWTKVSSLQFLVSWSGYDESFDQWLPWKELRLTEQLHAYLREHGKERLIPRNIENVPG